MRWFLPILFIVLLAGFVAVGALAANVNTSQPIFVLGMLAWIFFGVLTLMIIQKVLEQNRRRHADATKRCFLCGYDLRATPNRCPECGAEPPTRPPDYYDGR